jgi:hypothetical protein
LKIPGDVAQVEFAVNGNQDFQKKIAIAFGNGDVADTAFSAS